MTMAEKCYVQEQAAKANMSEAEYVRRRALDYSVKASSNVIRFDPALVHSINDLGNQLAALGNLANQVALYCHTDRPIPDTWDSLPTQINDLLDVVAQTLEEMVLTP